MWKGDTFSRCTVVQLNSQWSHYYNFDFHTLVPIPSEVKHHSLSLHLLAGQCLPARQCFNWRSFWPVAGAGDTFVKFTHIAHHISLSRQSARISYSSSSDRHAASVCDRVLQLIAPTSAADNFLSMSTTLPQLRKLCRPSISDVKPWPWPWADA